MPIDRGSRDRVGREVGRVARAQLREHEADRWPMPPRPGRAGRSRGRRDRPAEHGIPVHRRGHQQLAVRADVEGRQRPRGQPERAGAERLLPVALRGHEWREHLGAAVAVEVASPDLRRLLQHRCVLHDQPPELAPGRWQPGKLSRRRRASRRSRPFALERRRPSRRPCPIACPPARTRRCGRRSRPGPRSAPRAWGRRLPRRRPSPTSRATGRAGRAMARPGRAPRPGRHRRDRPRAASRAGRAKRGAAGRRSSTRRRRRMARSPDSSSGSALEPIAQGSPSAT